MVDKNRLPTWAEDADEVDLTERERQIISIIMEQGCVGYQSDIADRLGVKRQAMRRPFQNLEEKGLIQPLEENANPKFYEITKKAGLVLLWSRKLDTDEGKIRLRHHKRRIRFGLVEGHQEISEVENELKTVELEHWEQLQGKAGLEHYFEEEVSYMITPNCLVVDVPERYVPPTCEGVGVAVLEAVWMAKKAKEEVEEEHENLVFGRARPVFSDQHFAFERHPSGILLSSADYECSNNLESGTKIKWDESLGHPEVEVEGSASEESAMNIAENLKFQAENSLEQKFEEINNRLEELDRTQSEQNFTAGYGR